MRISLQSSYLPTDSSTDLHHDPSKFTNELCVLLATGWETYDGATIPIS